MSRFGQFIVWMKPHSELHTVKFWFVCGPADLTEIKDSIIITSNVLPKLKGQIILVSNRKTSIID